MDSDSKEALLYNVLPENEYIILDLELFNKGKKDIIISSLYNLKGNLDGEEVITSLSGVLAESLKSIDGLYRVGETKSGAVVYKVSENWKILTIKLAIENIEEEPILKIENPKNRIISKQELEKIKEKYNLEGYIDEEKLDSLIVEFMHNHALSKNDTIPSSELIKYIESEI